MWALPNIIQMNANKAASQATLKRQTRLGKSRKHSCDNCNKPSTSHVPYYDIFSDDISGVTHLCDHCRESGHGEEGFFDCEACDRRMLDHITWERYAVDLDGRIICTACAAKEYFSDDDNLIDPAKIECVVQSPGGINQDLWTAEDGVVNLHAVKHVLAVKQPLPAGIVYVDNFENCNDAGRFDCQAILDAIKAQVKPCFLVLDGAYQFSESIGLYVREVA